MELVLNNIDLVDDFLKSVYSSKPVEGELHKFYNYPARFSPDFAKATINLFSNPGDVILDPYMGSGTTLIEAHENNRTGIGFDISTLSKFLVSVKLNRYTDKQLHNVKNWIECNIDQIKCNTNPQRPIDWIEKGYQRNISCKDTWRIRKLIEQTLQSVSDLELLKERNLARCAVLKTAQWALDCKKDIPTTAQFRKKLLDSVNNMTDYLMDRENHQNSNTHFYLGSAYQLHRNRVFKRYNPPKLVLTSPPYPGVHVLYHRWQIKGRKETPAPFWIADCLDGMGGSYYTMGSRFQKGLSTYYDNLKRTFSSIDKVIDRDTLIVQMVAFSKPEWQLPKYIETMRSIGYTEKFFPSNYTDSKDGRLWRNVPNRKWYADSKGRTSSSKEVVLFHQKI